jgi:hypothetical protein
MFEGFEGEGMKVKMQKPSKKKNLWGGWDGPYVFVAYKDGKHSQEQDEGGRTCIIKELNEKH